ncbi:MAG: hypothetical protein V3V02_01845 [Rhizobiaceae bacterium]
MTTELNQKPNENIDIALAQRIVDHWKLVISEAELRTEPYDHFHIDQAFPEDVYEMILENKISSEHFHAFNLKRWKRSDGTSTRDTMFLCEDSFEEFDDVRQKFWLTLTYALNSDILRQLVYKKMKADVALRLGVGEEDILNSDGYISSVLIRDSEGYRIKPHPDGQPRVATLAFYLPEDNSQADLGTSVYTDRGKLAGVVGKRFKEVYRFPFTRNSLAVFAVNDFPHRKSLHGRELVTAKGERNLIILSFNSETQQVKSFENQVPQTHNGLS